VNPKHLRPVTAREHNRLEAPKLDELTVAKIRVASGTHLQIARRFGVSRQLVGDIRRGTRWGPTAAQNAKLEALVTTAAGRTS